MIKMKSKAQNTPHPGWADLVQNKNKEKMSPHMNHLPLCPHPYSRGGMLQSSIREPTV